jgi:hypothetical protein
MNNQIKDLALMGVASVAAIGSVAILLGLPALWVAIAVFLIFDLGTILFLATVTNPPARRERKSDRPYRDSGIQFQPSR